MPQQLSDYKYAHQKNTNKQCTWSTDDKWQLKLEVQNYYLQSCQQQCKGIK